MIFPFVFPNDPFLCVKGFRNKIRVKQIDFIYNLCVSSHQSISLWHLKKNINSFISEEVERRWWWYWFIDVDEMKSFFSSSFSSMLNYWLEHNLMKKFFTLSHTNIYIDKGDRKGWNISDSVIFFLIQSFLFHSSQAVINQNENNMSNFLFYFLMLVFACLLPSRLIYIQYHHLPTSSWEN